MIDTINQIGPEKAMETVARWFSGHDKLKIHWTKTTNVCADIKTKTLFIPIACCSSNLSQEALLLLRAKIYHESAHILETSETKLKGAKFKILNALEDVRIEHKTAFKGEGVAFSYRFQNDKFNTEWASKISAGGISPFMEAIGYMMFVEDNIIPAWTLTPKSKELVDLASPVFSKVHDTKSSKDCEKLAEKIYELWKDKIEKEQEQEKQENEEESQEEQEEQNQEDNDPGDDGSGQNESGDGDGESDSDPEDGDGDSESGKQKSSPANKPPKEDGEEDSGDSKESSSGKKQKDDSKQKDGKSKDPDKKGGKSKTKQSKAPPKTSAESENTGSEEKKQVSAEAQLEKEMEGEIKGENKDVAKELELAMKDPNFYTADRTIDKHVQEDLSKTDIEYYNSAKKDIGNEISALVKSAEQAFYFKKRTKTMRHIKHGDIDFTKLVPIAKGLSREVYMRKVDGEDLNTAVSIVVDQSGSMDERIKNVKLLLIAIGEMLQKIGVPFEIFGTTTYSSSQENRAFTRYRGVKYIHYKNFNENWMIVHPRIMRLSSDDNNIDGEAVEYAFASLSTRKERRKIIFSICDGIPESGQFNDDVFRFQLKKTCERVRKAGTEVYAIGIDTEEPSKYYGNANFIEIDSKNMLSPTSIRVFTDTIMQGKFSVTR